MSRRGAASARAGSARGAQFAVLCAHALLFQAVTFLLRPTASYRAIELDVPAAWLGLLAAGFALVPLVVALPAGDLADRFGESRVMGAGAVVVAGAAALYLLAADTFALLLVATLVLGAGHLLCAVGQQSMVAALSPDGRLDSAYGYYTFAGTIGQVVGPGLLGVLGSGAALPPTGLVFRVATGIALALVVVSLLARTPAGARIRAARADRRVTSLLRTPGLTRALVVSAIVIAATDVTLVYLPALGAERGMSVAAVSALLTVRSVSTMLARLGTGALTAWLGRRRLLVTSIGASGVAMLLLLPDAPLWVGLVGVAVMGVGLGVCQPATLAWLAEVAPPGLRGRVMSLRLVGNRLGQVVVPSGVGLVAAGLGAAGVLAATAGSLLVAAVAARSVTMDTGDRAATALHSRHSAGEEEP